MKEYQQVLYQKKLVKSKSLLKEFTSSYGIQYYLDDDAPIFLVLLFRVHPPSFRSSTDGAQSMPHSTPESRRVSVASAGAASVGHTPQRHSLASPQPFNPLIYGNDVDSVDVATRVAMVS